MSPNQAGLIAIVDVETTGLFPFRHDRVIEIAVVVVDPNGRIVREFVSLINPGRDIGPTRIHGLVSEDILHAPTFSEIAGQLLVEMSECVALAGHNFRFDRLFMQSEFARIGASLPEFPTYCTMELAGGGALANCCRDYDIEFGDYAHQALVDARATARLLAKIIDDEPRLLKEMYRHEPVSWPGIVCSMKPALTRKAARRRQSEPPTFMQRLIDRVRDQGAMTDDDDATMAYSALLDRVLEDRRIDDAENDSLYEMAVRYGLSPDQVQRAHRKYVDQLAVAAVADGVVTDAERRDLKLVARLLGQGQRDLDGVLKQAAEHLERVRHIPVEALLVEDSLDGKRVCFTGDFLCKRDGTTISREVATELAVKAGLIVEESVTKRLDLLVLADPHTQSGKAKKARQYSVRIMHEPVFWKSIGVKVE